MDVFTAFLNGDLDEDIYMHIPEGLKTPENESKVCKLNKALYGLKQAPRQWYAKIHEYLTNDLKFVSSINDPCLYILKSSNEILIIAIYVDDLLLIINSKSMIDKLKGEFKKRFEMKDLGAVTVMLGIEIKRDILFLDTPEPISIGILNTGTMYLADNPAINERSKYIDV